ncbi:hypothetical protein [Coxiella burnetii]|uniref:hypothetical protein n=1 Tax=Coxiella burnetii TaxID=777 RepID=UPI001F2B0BBB|nr:hypothetical protein [Coxiella burnetii]
MKSLFVSIDDKAALLNRHWKHLRPMLRGIFYQLLLEELAQRLTLDLSELDSLTVAPPPHALPLLPECPLWLTMPYQS